MIKAIIFDCFGVIYPDTLSLISRHFKVPVDKKLEIRNLRILSDQGNINRNEFWDGIAKIVGKSRHDIENELNNFSGADWELLEYIKLLKKSYKTGILSNVGSGFLDRIFDDKHIKQDYFDAVMASAEIGYMKPEINAYLISANRLATKPGECVMIDDQKRHVDGAISAGMKAIIYQNFDQMKLELAKTLAVS